MMNRLFLLLLLLLLVSSVSAQDEGAGTFKDPFVINYLADSGALTSLRVTGLERPADRGDGMAAPAEGEEAVIVSVDLECAVSRSENCYFSSFDFELSGENGIVYETDFEAGGAVEIELLPGGAASVDWPFLVSSDDAHLTLHYYNHQSMQFAFPQIFATEARAEVEPIEAVPTISIVTRVGPRSDLAFAGVLHRGETLLAHGRNADGDWLEMGSIGWVPAEFIETEGDIMSLPITR